MRRSGRRRAAVVIVTCVASLVGLAIVGTSSVRPPDRAAGSAAPGSGMRERVDLNAGWRFIRNDPAEAQDPAFDDAGWADVAVPHTWNGADGQDGGGDYHRGVGWYRRHYTPPAGFAGRRLWLQFDGVGLVADVWVNGIHLGRHAGGFARFRFDATDALRPGRDNVIAVEASNAFDPDLPPLSADFTFFGGIYRAVSLWATDPLAVDPLDAAGPGVYLRQRVVTARSAAVDVVTLVRNDSPVPRRASVRTMVADAAGTIVVAVTSAPIRVAVGGRATVTQPVTIADPRRWQGRADPYLYRVTVEVRDAATGAVRDAVTQRLGLRSVSVDPAAGLFLNGVRVEPRGVNRHQDRPGRGWALTDADHTGDFDLMDEMGVNALRTAHYQQDQRVYDLADERGYLVWTEIPLVNAVTGGMAFRANAERQLRELIRQNYNHSAIVFWGIGNEQEADDAATNELLAGLAALVAAEDPDRFSAYAHATDVVAGGLTGHTRVTGYNRYYGWYYGAPDQLGPFLDRARGARPTRPIVVSEYGAGASVRQHAVAAEASRPVPWSAWHPEEYQSLVHEAAWAQIRARTYLCGAFVWNMFDFAADQRAEGDSPGRNDKGLVTYDRAVRKDAFYWYKANWTTTPFVHLTSRRWTERVAATTTVKVYGTVDSVLLRVNGVVVGAARTADNHIYRWPGVALSRGTNTIEVVGTRDGRTYTDTAVWTLH